MILRWDIGYIIGDSMLNFFIGVLVGGFIVDFLWAWHNEIPQRFFQRARLWYKLRTASKLKKMRSKKLYK